MLSPRHLGMQQLFTSRFSARSLRPLASFALPALCASSLLLGCGGCANHKGPKWHSKGDDVSPYDASKGKPKQSDVVAAPGTGTAEAESQQLADALLPAPNGGVITLDGDTSDWPTDIVAISDEHHLYMRFTIENDQFALQAANESTTILLDTDGNSKTGQLLQPGELSNLGVDMEVVFSPAKADGSQGRGVAMYAIANDGSRTPLSVYDWDFSCVPTHASTWYEARISRTPEGDVPQTLKGLFGTHSVVRGAFALTNTQGALLAWSPAFEVVVPERCTSEARFSNVGIPKKPAGGVRVLSYNVLRGSPKQKPEVYSRILKAIDADVLLVQEWESSGATEMQQWFASNLGELAGSQGSWQSRAVAGEVAQGGGVAVVSRLPITGPLLDGPVMVEGRPMRFIGAVIDSPVGELHVGSTHLKCCGTLNSSEDQQRMAEAQAINAAVKAATNPNATVIIAGDMNLVGGRAPLDALTSGLDVDGSALEAAPARTLGDRSYITWSEDGNNFGPGRLDYVLASDGGSVRIARSFVLNTARLSDATLKSMGVLRTDSAQASDHLPVVVDFVK
jgi:endonuclease/exonuclease/phosphatase family metal-dependent hydrolase